MGEPTREEIGDLLRRLVDTVVEMKDRVEELEAQLATTPSLDDLAVAELEWAADKILRKCATTQKELDSQICAAAAIAAIIKTAGGKKDE